MTRKRKLEHLVTTGKIEGKSNRGRRRIQIQGREAVWLGRSTAGKFVDVKDHEHGKGMIAYAATLATDVTTEEEFEALEIE